MGHILRCGGYTFLRTKEGRMGHGLRYWPRATKTTIPAFVDVLWFELHPDCPSDGFELHEEPVLAGSGWTVDVQDRKYVYSPQHSPAHLLNHTFEWEEINCVIVGAVEDRRIAVRTTKPVCAGEWMKVSYLGLTGVLGDEQVLGDISSSDERELVREFARDSREMRARDKEAKAAKRANLLKLSAARRKKEHKRRVRLSNLKLA